MSFIPIESNQNDRPTIFSIPVELIESQCRGSSCGKLGGDDPLPPVGRLAQKHVSRIELVGGGGIETPRGFDQGPMWYNDGPRGRGKFDPVRMARHLLSCPIGDICVMRPTLHGVDEVSEVAALRNQSFHNELRLLAQDPDHGWIIALAPSVQHFYPPEVGKALFGGQPGVNLAADVSGCAGSWSGGYTAGAHNTTVLPPQCQPAVCPTAREEAFVGLRQLGLPLAILGADLMHRHGGSHISPAVFGVGKHGGQDCTHWCAPGMSDAIASVVLSLVDLYGGSRWAFESAAPAAPTAAAAAAAAAAH